jgi:hypothetical protein
MKPVLFPRKFYANKETSETAKQPAVIQGITTLSLLKVAQNLYMLSEEAGTFLIIICCQG